MWGGRPRHTGSAGRDRRLRRTASQVLRDLDAPNPLDIYDLCRRFAEHRGRPLTVRTAVIPVPGPTGIWVDTVTGDHVFVQQNTTPVHQMLILVHELGHIIAGHNSDPDETCASLMGAVDPGMLEILGPDVPRWTMLAVDDTSPPARHRNNYDDEQEQDAERIASVILEWSDRAKFTAPPSAATEIGRRAQDALSERPGWVAEQ